MRFTIAMTATSRAKSNSRGRCGARSTPQCSRGCLGEDLLERNRRVGEPRGIDAGLGSRMSRCTSSLTSHTLTFMPRDHPAVEEPERHELAGVAVAAEDGFDALRRARRSRSIPCPDRTGRCRSTGSRVLDRLARERPARRLARILGVRPVLDADSPAEDGVEDVRDIADGVDVGDARAERGIRRRSPSSTCSPAASASSVAGMAPMPITTTSAGMTSPPSTSTPVTRPSSPTMRGDLRRHAQGRRRARDAARRRRNPRCRRSRR